MGNTIFDHFWVQNWPFWGPVRAPPPPPPLRGPVHGPMRAFDKTRQEKTRQDKGWKPLPGTVGQMVGNKGIVHKRSTYEHGSEGIGSGSSGEQERGAGSAGEVGGTAGSGGEQGLGM